MIMLKWNVTAQTSNVSCGFHDTNSCGYTTGSCWNNAFLSSNSYGKPTTTLSQSSLPNFIKFVFNIRSAKRTIIWLRLRLRSEKFFCNYKFYTRKPLLFDDCKITFCEYKLAIGTCLSRYQRFLVRNIMSSMEDWVKLLNLVLYSATQSE